MEKHFSMKDTYTKLYSSNVKNFLTIKYSITDMTKFQAIIYIITFGFETTLSVFSDLWILINATASEKN